LTNKNESQPKSKSSKGVVLIADDSVTNVQILKACLVDEYEIITASNGEECLKLAAKNPDLILLDIEMPIIDGYEVCRRLKSDKQTRNIPVIFVTSKNDGGDEELGFNLGAVDYITKPIKPTVVMARTKTHVTLKQQKDKLKEMATRDQLTGLYNRHYLLENASQKVARARRHNDIFSLLMIDVDHFKQINDKFGHRFGDYVLEEVSRALRSSVRKEDIAARFGGEEFIIILDSSNLENSEVKANILRDKVAAIDFDKCQITISLGVAEFCNENESFDDVLERADQALYQAKNSGRNCVVISNNPSD
jgi:diguanylate cyclase (GGDEF)-like protein